MDSQTLFGNQTKSGKLSAKLYFWITLYGMPRNPSPLYRLLSAKPFSSIAACAPITSIGSDVFCDECWAWANRNLFFGFLTLGVVN